MKSWLSPKQLQECQDSVLLFSFLPSLILWMNNVNEVNMHHICVLGYLWTPGKVHFFNISNNFKCTRKASFKNSRNYFFKGRTLFQSKHSIFLFCPYNFSEILTLTCNIQIWWKKCIWLIREKCSQFPYHLYVNSTRVLLLFDVILLRFQLDFHQRAQWKQDCKCGVPQGRTYFR